MNLARNVILSYEILAAHKLRTLLSVTGIVVGVAAVVLIVSVGQGAQKRILDRIRSMGTHLIVVKAGQTQILAGRERQMTMVTTLLPEDAATIVKECDSVAAAAPAISKKITVKWESETAITNVVGTSSDGFLIRNMQIASGRCFDVTEDRARRRLAIVGATTACNLFGDIDPVGLQIQIDRVPFEVIGVMTPRGADLTGADQDDLIVVPIETVMRRLMNVTYVQTIYVQAKSSDLLDRAEKEIRGLLEERHRLGSKQDDFTIQNQETLLESERVAGRSLTLLAGSVAGIVLLVGGVGILAVMLITVRERRREIGLRRALGALRRDIRNQFLLESGILAATGGVIGVIVGIGSAVLVSLWGQWGTIISWPSAGGALAFSIIVGMVFGIHPAIRAASMEPIDALRAE